MKRPVVHGWEADLVEQQEAFMASKLLGTKVIASDTEQTKLRNG